MKLIPLNCPHCGSSLSLEPEASLVTCAHCRSSFIVERPDSEPARRYTARDPSSPVVFCPVCSAQTLRDIELAGKPVACHACGETSLMPDRHERRIRVCQVCQRAHFEPQCPTCNHLQRNRRVIDLFD